ncbi:hypothetical protein L596_011764 [Steinernema carpocapsae]|nr:hypothetical protein L596_011764 [Steinernema carpocapsae]
MPLCAAAYADDPTECVQKHFDRKHVQIQGPVSGECDLAGETCSAFVVTSHNDSAIIIVFRGAEDLNELNRMLSESKHMEKFIGGGKVAKGYLDAINSLDRSGLKDLFFGERNQNPNYQIWVTGHNIGGAMASIYAAQLVFNKQADPDKVMMVSLGQPRTGDKDYAQAHDSLVTNSFRVVHRRDQISMLPGRLFTHFYHHASEIWYNNDMSTADYQTCGGDDEGCEDTDLIPILLDDFYYYHTKKSINDYGKGGC